MRLYAAFAGAIFAILFAAAGTFGALREWQSSNEWLDHSYEVREAVSRLLELSVECEGGVRGYLMTGDDSPLQRFRTNAEALSPALEAAERLTTDNPAQNRRAQEAHGLIVEMLAEMNREIAARSPVSPHLVRAVRIKVTEMMDEETALLASRRVAWLRQRQRVVAVALGGSLLLLLLTGLAALVVRGDLRRREQAVSDKAALYQFQERLISIVGHDLRNPLSAVLVSAQMLLKRKDELNEGQVQAVERIARSASRIDALGNLLVDFTQARLGGGVPLRREPSDARPAVERAIDELRSANPTRALQLEVRTASTSGNWDVERIAQIVSNLAGNALRYGAKDSAVTVSLEDAQPEAMVIAVHNRGDPIASELLPHLFEPYKRGAAAPTAYAGGLGLGLYIVREIAVAHGGEVTLQSTAEGGTTFRAKLPRAAPRVSLD
jgi:signal transduction histidine kinase